MEEVWPTVHNIGCQLTAFSRLETEIVSHQCITEPRDTIDDLVMQAVTVQLCFIPIDGIEA